MDPAEGVEPIAPGIMMSFPGEIIIELKDKALEHARGNHDARVFWTDGSKLDTADTGAGVAWMEDGRWKIHQTRLGKNKEVFDAELWGVSDSVRNRSAQLRFWGTAELSGIKVTAELS